MSRILGSYQCKTVEIIPGSEKIRTLNLENINNCLFLGTVQSFKDSLHEGAIGAVKDSKNQAVRMKGNAIVITKEINNRNYSEILADVYDCPAQLSRTK